MPAPRPSNPVRLVPFSEELPRTSNQLLCDGVTAHNLASFADLLKLHAFLQQKRPDRRVLASLDDLRQAGANSRYAADGCELDLIGSAEPEGAFANYVSGPEEFPIRLANLVKRAEGIDLVDATGALQWETPGDSNGLITVNGDPERALRIADEEQVIFQFVPVATAAEAIAAFPVGYFSSDLSPMQNFLLARHLETAYGLSLIGIGSRFLAFHRAAAIEPALAHRLAFELAALYANAPQGAAHALARVITGRDWLLLRYTES
jgi:hypothetical protein